MTKTVEGSMGLYSRNVSVIINTIVDIYIKLRIFATFPFEYNSLVSLISCISFAMMIIREIADIWAI